MQVLKEGKIIGETEGQIFSKYVRKSRHLFKKLNAWGIDAAFFDSVLLPNNMTIKIYETEGRKVYSASAQYWKENGQYLHFKGHGAQIFLSLDKFINKYAKEKI